MLLEYLIFSFPSLWELNYAALTLLSKGNREWFPHFNLQSFLPQGVTKSQNSTMFETMPVIKYTQTVGAIETKAKSLLNQNPAFWS